MTNPSPGPAANSFLKAVVLIFVGVIPVLVLAVSSGKRPEAAGYMFGYYSTPFILSGIAVGIWAKLSKSPWNWAHYSDSDVHHTDFGFMVPLPNSRFQFDEDLQERAHQEFAQRGEDTMEWSPNATGLDATRAGARVASWP